MCGDLVYPSPDGASDLAQRIETQWYIYWLQSIPGVHNAIRHDSGFLTNWWATICDWDFAITHDHGLHALQPTAVPDSPEITGGSGSQLRLVSLTPNPMTMGLRLEFSLATALNVDAGVYDAAGRLVARLTHEGFPSGHHAVDWDGRDVHGNRAPAGIYFLHLAGPGVERTQEVMVLR